MNPRSSSSKTTKTTPQGDHVTRRVHQDLDDSMSLAFQKLDDYIRINQIEAELNQPYPAWHLSPSGIILAANSMAFWLWQALSDVGVPDPDKLLGHNALEILAEHVDRIPLSDNHEALEKSIAFCRKLESAYGWWPYRAYSTMMHADPERERIVAYSSDTDAWRYGSIWKFPLKIRQVGSWDPTTLLEFVVDVSGVHPEAGYFVRYLPTDITERVLQGDARVAHLRAQRASIRAIPPVVNKYNKVYYPWMVHDNDHWTILWENQALQLLFKTNSLVGRGLLDVIFSDLGVDVFGKDEWTPQARRAWNFYVQLHKDRPAEIEALKARYSPWLRRHTGGDPEAWFADALRMPISLDLYCRSCEHRDVRALSHTGDRSTHISMRILSVVWQEKTGDWVNLLAPETPATDAAMILAFLSNDIRTLSRTKPGDLPRLRCDLAAVQTVVTGLSSSGVAPEWDPRNAFRQFYEATEALATQHELPSVLQTKKEEQLDRPLVDAIQQWLYHEWYPVKAPIDPAVPGPETIAGHLNEVRNTIDAICYNIANNMENEFGYKGSAAEQTYGQWSTSKGSHSARPDQLGKTASQHDDSIQAAEESRSIDQQRLTPSEPTTPVEGDPFPSRRTTDSERANQLAEQYNLTVRNVPESIYPGMPYFTVKELVEKRVTSYTEQYIWQLIRAQKLSHGFHRLETTVFVDPDGVDELRARERVSRENPQGRLPGSKSRAPSK